jgi:hypothetical protein
MYYEPDDHFLFGRGRGLLEMMMVNPQIPRDLSGEGELPQQAVDKSVPDHYIESFCSVFTVKIDDVEQAKKLAGKWIYKREYSPFPRFKFQIKLFNVNSETFYVALKNCGKTTLLVKNFSPKVSKTSGYVSYGLSDSDSIFSLQPNSSVEMRASEFMEFKKFSNASGHLNFECSVEFVIPKYGNIIYSWF